jgi:hypothetical protein
VYETEIRRIINKNFKRTMSTEKKLGVVAHACHPSYGRKHKIRTTIVQANLGKNQDTMYKLT